MAIKSQPEDFVVEEELDPAFLDAVSPRPGPFALLEVCKRLLTTHEALDLLARRLRVPVDDLAAAGLKDKQAITTQHVTLRLDPNRRLTQTSVESAELNARHIGFVPQAIDSRAILRNRFRIVLRDLTRTAAADLATAASRFAIDAPRQSDALGTRLLITNYFGNQRFGSARAGQGFVAAHLVRGEFDQALRLALAVAHRKDDRQIKRFKQAVAAAWDSHDWSGVLQDSPRIAERAAIEHLARKPDDYRGAFAALPYFFQQLCVEAYQSLLWNRIAAMLLIDRLGESGRLWVVDDKFGQLVFPEAGAIPADLLEMNMPLLGRRSELRMPWKDAALRVLAEENLSAVDALKIPGMDKPWFGESPRDLFMTAAHFSVAEPQPDDTAEPKSRRVKVTVTFTLPRGGYATVLLRALGQ